MIFTISHQLPHPHACFAMIRALTEFHWNLSVWWQKTPGSYSLQIWTFRYEFQSRSEHGTHRLWHLHSMLQFSYTAPLIIAPLIMVDHFLRSTEVRIQYKVEASIVDQVQLTTHEGHVMPTWMRSTFFTRTEFMFMCWSLVIVYPRKSFDNRYNQALAFRWVVIS